jgi:hypothetical protein
MKVEILRVSNTRPEERGGRPKWARYAGESGPRAENRAEESLYSQQNFRDLGK